MNREKIYEKLKEIILETFSDRGENLELTENINLIGELKLDSLEVVTIMVKAEFAFDIEINEEDITDALLNPVSNLVDYIEKKVGI